MHMLIWGALCNTGKLGIRPRNRGLHLDHKSVQTVGTYFKSVSYFLFSDPRPPYYIHGGGGGGGGGGFNGG